MMAALLRTISLAGLVMVPAMAAGAAFAASEGGGMPQFNPATFPSQLFWLGVILVIFFAAMRLSALPRIGAALEARRQKIDGDLDKAATHREEAEAVKATYEKSLAEAADKAHAIQRQAAEAMAANAAQRRAAAAERLAAEIKAAEERITAAKEPALASLQDVAADVVELAADRIAGVKVSTAEAKAAIKDVQKEGR